MERDLSDHGYISREGWETPFLKYAEGTRLSLGDAIIAWITQLCFSICHPFKFLSSNTEQAVLKEE